MKYPIFVLLLLQLITQAAEKPNIILFFVDDMGWDDLGYRDPRYETPNLDKLATESIDFQQAYIPCPTCSPSRAALVTGQHPAKLQLVRHIPTSPKHGGDAYGRTNKEFNLWPKDPAQFPSRNWLPLEKQTYAEALRELGYYNLFVGKWHLGHEPYHPIHQGFHRQIGTTNWGNPKSYYPPYFRHNEVFADETERYLTDKLTDETVSFINDYQKEEPFMISLWYYSVHAPLQGRRDLVKHFRKKGFKGKEAHYAAMVTTMDESIGRIRKALHQRKISDDTVIIFLSDQGSLFENKPFRGGKKSDTLCEGGARVPLIIHWPKVIKPNQKSNEIVQSTDLFPTLVDIAGGSPKQFANLDGLSLLPTLKNNTPIQRKRPIFGYRAYQDLYASAREGSWKLLAYRSGKTELYNLSKDLGETTDISKEHPEITTRLAQQLRKWEGQVGVEKFSGIK